MHSYEPCYAVSTRLGKTSRSRAPAGCQRCDPRRFRLNLMQQVYKAWAKVKCEGAKHIMVCRHMLYIECNLQSKEEQSGVVEYFGHGWHSNENGLVARFHIAQHSNAYSYMVHKWHHIHHLL